MRRFAVTVEAPPFQDRRDLVAEKPVVGSRRRREPRPESNQASKPTRTIVFITFATLARSRHLDPRESECADRGLAVAS